MTITEFAMRTRSQQAFEEIDGIEQEILRILSVALRDRIQEAHSLFVRRIVAYRFLGENYSTETNQLTTLTLTN